MRMFRNIITLVLFAFDAFALVRGLHPQVSDLYRACHIRHSMDFRPCVDLMRRDTPKNLLH